MDRELLSLLLAQGLSLEQIGRRFGRNPTTVGYWVRKHGLEAVHRERHAPKGGLDRSEVERLIEAGNSLSAIATACGVSESTVKHWLRKWGLKTRRAAQRATASTNRQAGRAIIELTCPHHGVTKFGLEGRGSYRCLRCRSEGVSRRRRRIKAILVEEAGGECRICGYRRSVVALEFHHVDPSKKRFTLGYGGLTRAIETMREEAKKCVLLCANCHAEVEAGIVELPPDLVRR